MHCCTCNKIKSDTEVYWGQDCDDCRHGCYVPSVDFTEIDASHTLFANIIKPHHFLRFGARIEIIYWDGGLTGAYVTGGISRGGRTVGHHGMWIRLKYLGIIGLNGVMKKIKAGINPIIGLMSSCDECQIPREETTRTELLNRFKEYLPRVQKESRKKK